MTDYFVSSVDGNNADDGLSWANAKQTVAGALAVPAISGDIILVDSAHAFVATAAITWTPPAGVVAIISVNRAGSDAWLAGASESVGASSQAFLIPGAAASSMYLYGMTINGGTNASASCDISFLIGTTQSSIEAVSCIFDLKSATTGSQIRLGDPTAATGKSNTIRFNNCTFISSGSHAGSLFLLQRAAVEIINPTFSMTGATKPAILFDVAGTQDMGSITVRDGDASGYDVTSGALINVANLGNVKFILENLKISPTPTLTTGTWPGGAGRITLRNVDSGDTTYKFQRIDAYGTLTADSGIYLSSGGAQFDGAGISWKIVTTTLCNEYTPFVLPIMEIWGATLTAQTAEIEIVHDSATEITDRDAWTNLEYISSSAFPIGTLASNRNANPFTGTPVDVPASSNTWTGTGGFGVENKQKFQHTFTAAAPGLITAELKIGIASKTLYVAPVINGVT